MKLKSLNRRFKQDYDRVFQKDPESANLFLLLFELANERGEVVADERELARLFNARFKNPREYALKRVANE